MWTLNDEIRWWDSHRPMIMYAIECIAEKPDDGDPMRKLAILTLDALKSGPPRGDET